VLLISASGQFALVFDQEQVHEISAIVHLAHTHIATCKYEETLFNLIKRILMHEEPASAFATGPIKLFRAQIYQGHMLICELHLVKDEEELSMILEAN
jgi:hypothetical protein